MLITIYGKENNRTELVNILKTCLEDMGLVDFITVNETDNEEIKNELNISKEPALIIEEPEIDFKDTIFEGMVPSEEEIKSMLMSIIGGGESGGCAPEGCGSGCSC